MDDQEGRAARILDATETLCIAQGNATAAEVATATACDLQTVKAALAMLAQAGKLIARPGGVYARGLLRQMRLPGQSWKHGLVGPVPAAKLMGAR